MNEKETGEPLAVENDEPATQPSAPPARSWWLCRIDDSNPKELQVLADSESAAVEKFKRAQSIRHTPHSVSARRLNDYRPSERDLELERLLK